MTEKVTTLEVFNAISRLPEEEKLCVLQFIGLPGLANTLNSKEEYEKAVDKMAFYIDTYKVAIRAIKNIHDDVEKQLIMKQKKTKSWRDCINPFKGKGSNNEQSEKQA